MKVFERKLILAAIGLLVASVHQCFTQEADYPDDNNIDGIDFSTLRSFKSLTPEEEALANEARAHIAKTIEKNLIRLLAIASTQSERQSRQDDDDDDVTPNPNVLPQVAQILGAIFSGSLNITRVVDQTFGLVPNVVRNQVGGLVKLLTGQNMNATATSTSVASSTAKAAESTDTTTTPEVVTSPPLTNPPKAKARTSPPATERAVEVEVLEIEVTSTSTNPPEPALEDLTQNLVKQQGNNTSRIRYKIRNRNRQPTTTSKSLLEDDELEKLEDDLKRAARAYEPYMRNPEPRFIADAFRRVFGRVDFNSTQISSAVPTIFNGARQALVVLDSLGILDANDLLDELGLPTGEEEEE